MPAAPRFRGAGRKLSLALARHARNPLVPERSGGEGAVDGTERSAHSTSCTHRRDRRGAPTTPTPPPHAARRHPTEAPRSHARPKTLLPGKWREVARSPCRPRGGNPRVPSPGGQSAGWSWLGTVKGGQTGKARNSTARGAPRAAV